MQSSDAGGRTLAEIKAARKRMQDMRDIINEIREEREAKTVKELLDRDFPQGGEKRAAMEEVLSDDIHDVKGSLNRAIQTTKDQLAALTGADEKIQYLQEKQKNGSPDVGLITYVGDSGQYESIRVSGNEGWYSEFYKNNKKAPTQRDAYEIDYRETMEEISHSDDPEAAEAGKEIEALHSKLETLEELTDYVGKLDQDDLITKSQMSEDAYKTIYTPAVRALSHGSPNVAKAAKDSALLYAKMADALHEAYQLPYDDIAKIQIGERPGSGYSQYMSPEDQLAIDEKHFADMIDRFMSGEEMSGAIRVMRTPIVMKLVGADILPVEISIANMKKILQVKHQKGMSPQIMKQIPRALSDPLFIANSYGNRKVVALDLKDETGAGVIVALELGRKGTEYTVNSIRSIYGKTKKKTDTPDWEWLANQFTEYHTVEYVNKRKTINWIHNEKLETLLPYESIDGFFTSIKANEEDLVKLKQENPTYYQMAGVRAGNAPMERLAEAKAMWESMKPEEEIFRKTGWIRKKDGKWRWEIPDNLEDIHLEALLKNPGKKIGLEELYDNPKLYEAYPFLKNIQVYTFQGKEAQEYNGITRRTEDGQIEIGVREKGLRDDPKEARSTLVHEIQHVIQFYEGFAVGGNPHSIQRQMRAEKESSEAFIKAVPYAEEWLKYDSMASDLAFRALENPLLETDANAAQERADELEKKIPKDRKRQLRDAQYRIEQIEDILRETNKKNFDLYWDLHGEIEARDTAVRAENAFKYDKDIKEAKKKVESAGKAMMEAISKLSGKERRDAEKWMTMEKALLKNHEKSLMYRPTDEEIDERIALEDALPESVQKEHDAWFQATWDYVGALQDKERGRYIPNSMVHDPNAIVVFGSLYVPYSTGRTYYQSNAVYGGQYSETENVIRVFDGGNMSTVVHESAHFWLSTMERVIREKAEERGIEGNLDEVLAAMKDRKDVPARLVKDMETIRSWAKYSPEHLAEYTGTILEKEFAKHAKSVLSGEAGAEERFIQERFARGFEQYLMTGRAPSKDLRGSFCRFKEWLTELYKTVKNLGVKPPSEVRRIFDKMVATQEEINSWSAERRLTQTDMKLDYTKTEQEQIAAWAEEIKERAKEKCLADFIEKTKADAQKLLDESIKEQREEWKRQLVAENPLYQMEVTRSLQVKKSDWTNYLESQGFDEKTFAEALQKAGGTLEARLAAMEADARKQYEESVMTPEMMRSAAEAQLAGPEGRAALAEMEAAMLKRRIDKYIRTAALSAMELDRAEDPVKLAYEIKKRNGLLTEADEKARKEAEAKERNKAEKGALRERALAAEESRRTLQEQLQSLIQGLKAARDGLKYDRRRLRQEAEWALSDEKISKATNWKWWDNKAQSASRRGRDAIRRNDWNGAAQEKLNELHFAMMARVAKEYQDNIQKTLHGNPKIASPTDKDGAERYGILGLLNRIGRKENPLRMTEMSRYFVQHMAYQMGLSTKDGIQPVNHEGRPIPFTWAALAMELNPTQAMTADQAGGVYLGDDVIAPWLKTLFESDKKTIMSTMTYDHFMAAAKAMQIAYRVGRREYEGNTLRLHGKPVSFMEAAMALILTKWDHSKHDPKREKLTDNTLQRIAKKLGKAVDDLTLPEILFERLGPEWYELFYQTIDTASTKERTMMEAANTAMMENINRYTRKEWQSTRNDKKYTYGLDSHGMPIRYTKEQVLSMALNWGNDTNRARLLETVGGTRDELEAFIMDTLDDKDWDFVEGVWNHINSYWDDRNRVQKNLYGVPLGKVAGTTFTLPSGREIHGQYYPIKYDAETAVSTAERSVNEIIQQQMAGVSTFGLGMGSTKSRAGASGGQNVRLDLEVYLSHVAEAVHHIAMREASVDVYKLITMAPVKDALVERLGVDTYGILKQWAADQWHSPIDRMSSWERMLGTLRKNMTFAAMAYRASTALLNITNILPLMERMGPMGALWAVGEMYFGGAYREQRKFVMEKSSYMRGRQVNMDRDLAKEKKLPVGQHTWKATAMAQGISDKVNAFGYAAIVETDFLFSLPQWTAVYKDSVRELSGKLSAEEIDAEAVRRADKAVRETFGSGEVKDQPAVVKGKFLSQMLPFYSYTSLVLNQFIRAGYIAYDRKDFMPLLRTTLFWYVLGSFTEAAFREAFARASGDDKDDYWKRVMLSLAGGGPIGGVPIARDLVPWAAAKAMGMYQGDGKSDVAAMAVFEQISQAYSDLLSEKKTWLDVGRDVTRVTNRIYRGSDTVTDGFWSLLKLLTMDTEKTGMEVIASLALDKDVIQRKGDKE